MSKVKDYNSKKKIRRINVEMMDDGGATCSIEHMRDKEDSMGKGASLYEDSYDARTLKTAHPNAHHLMRHLKEHLTRHGANSGVMKG